MGQFGHRLRAHSWWHHDVLPFPTGFATGPHLSSGQLIHMMSNCDGKQSQYLFVCVCVSVCGWCGCSGIDYPCLAVLVRPVPRRGT